VQLPVGLAADVADQSRQYSHASMLGCFFMHRGAAVWQEIALTTTPHGPVACRRSVMRSCPSLGRRSPASPLLRLIQPCWATPPPLRLSQIVRTSQAAARRPPPLRPPAPCGALCWRGRRCRRRCSCGEGAARNQAAWQSTAEKSWRRGVNSLGAPLYVMLSRHRT